MSHAEEAESRSLMWRVHYTLFRDRSISPVMPYAMAYGYAPQTVRKYENVSSLRIVAATSTSTLVFEAKSSLNVETREPIASSSYVCAILTSAESWWQCLLFQDSSVDPRQEPVGR